MKTIHNGIEVEWTDEEWKKIKEIQASRQIPDKQDGAVARKNKYEGPRLDFSVYTRTSPIIPPVVQALIYQSTHITTGATRTLTKSQDYWKYRD